MVIAERALFNRQPNSRENALQRAEEMARRVSEVFTGYAEAAGAALHEATRVVAYRGDLLIEIGPRTPPSTKPPTIRREHRGAARRDLGTTLSAAPSSPRPPPPRPADPARGRRVHRRDAEKPRCSS